jgi:hypothetical protein
MADSEIHLHIKTTGDNAAANATAQAIRGVDEAAKRLNPQLNELRQNKEKLATTTKNTGQNMLQLAYVADDLQYGLRGVINNIPMLLTSLGAGAGLAGILSIAAVGVSVLINNLDLFGEKADDAAQKARKLAEDADFAAGASRKHAEQMNAEQAAAKGLETRLEEASTAYRRQTAAIEENIAALQRKLAAEQALADAKTAQGMAEIDLQEADGAISPADAAYRRRELQKNSNKEKFDREQKEDQGRAAAEADKANQAAKDAAQKRREAEILDRESKNALDKEEKERIEKKKKSLEDDIKEREGKIDKMPDTVEEFSGAGPGGYARKTSPNQAKAAERARLREVQEELEEANNALNRDKSARRGGGSREEMIKKAEELRRKAQEEDGKNQEAIRRQNEAKERMKNRGELFPEQESARDKETDARVRRITRKQEEEAAEQAAKQKEKEERSFNKAARGVRDEDDFLPPAIRNELEKALQEGPSGSKKQAEIIGKLAAWLKKQNLENSDLKKRLEQLEAVIAEISDGR